MRLMSEIIAAYEKDTAWNCDVHALSEFTLPYGKALG